MSVVLIPRQQACIAHCRHFRHPSHRETLSPRCPRPVVPGGRDIALLERGGVGSASGTVAGNARYCIGLLWPSRKLRLPWFRAIPFLGQLGLSLGAFLSFYGTAGPTHSLRTGIARQSWSTGDESMRTNVRSAISSASSVSRASPETVAGCNARQVHSAPSCRRSSLLLVVGIMWVTSGFELETLGVVVSVFNWTPFGTSDSDSDCSPHSTMYECCECYLCVHANHDHCHGSPAGSVSCD